MTDPEMNETVDPETGEVKPGKERRNLHGQGRGTSAMLPAKYLESFKAWLEENGWAILPPTNSYEMVRAKKEGEPLLILWSRKRSGNLRVRIDQEWIVGEFLRAGKREPKPPGSGTLDERKLYAIVAMHADITSERGDQPFNIDQGAAFWVACADALASKLEAGPDVTKGVDNGDNLH